MAVAVDVTGTSAGDATFVARTSFNYTGITVGTGSNRALVFVAVINRFGGPQPTGPTAVWDSGGTNQSMALLVTGTETVTGDPIFIFGLRNPASGNKTLALNWTNSCSFSGNAISFTGVDQTNDAAAFPHTNTNSGTAGGTASVNVTSAAGNYVVAGFTGPALTVTSDTEYFNTVNQSIYCDDWNGFAQYGSGSASKTISYTTMVGGTNWGAAGVDIAAAVTDILAAQIWM